MSRKKEYESVPEDEYPVIDDNSKGWVKKEWGYGDENDENNDSGQFEVLIPLDQETPWFKKYWRPAIAWQYFAVCLFDFLIAPIATMMFFYYTGQVYVQWVPLTLQYGGLYHMAMAAIVGVYTWSRGLEKIKRVD